MENEKVEKTNDADLNYIKFLNQTKEEAPIVYIFKSIENAKQVMEEQSIDDNVCCLIASFELFDEDKLVKSIDALNDVYGGIILIKDENNFTEKEIFDLSLKSSSYICCDNDTKWILGGRCLSPYLFSKIVKIINYQEPLSVGKKVPLGDYYRDCGLLEKSNREMYIFYKNMIVKVWAEYKAKDNKSYFKILTNYSFKILNIFNYNDGIKKQDIELEMTDFKGDTSRILLSATDKSSLSAFRKNINPTDSFLDFMTNDDFNKIINQLYLENEYEVINKYDRPGLIADKNVYLTANEVIELEN